MDECCFSLRILSEGHMMNFSLGLMVINWEREGVSYITLNLTALWSSSLHNVSFLLRVWNINSFNLESTSFSPVIEKVVSYFLTKATEQLQIRKDMSFIPRLSTYMLCDLSTFFNCFFFISPLYDNNNINTDNNKQLCCRGLVI